jgi:hypothetical protein
MDIKTATLSSAALYASFATVFDAITAFVVYVIIAFVAATASSAIFIVKHYTLLYKITPYFLAILFCSGFYPLFKYLETNYFVDFFVNYCILIVAHLVAQALLHMPIFTSTLFICEEIIAKFTINSLKSFLRIKDKK